MKMDFYSEKKGKIELKDESEEREKKSGTKRTMRDMFAPQSRETSRLSWVYTRYSHLLGSSENDIFFFSARWNSRDSQIDKILSLRLFRFEKIFISFFEKIESLTNVSLSFGS